MTISSMPGGAEMTENVQSVLPVAALLGEGPVWIDGALWFVDIKSKRIYRFDPGSKTARHWDAPAEVGWVLPSTLGLLAGLQSGVHCFDPDSGHFKLLHAPEPNRPGNRLNDATVDSRGRLWFGTMDNSEGGATGRLYLLSAGRCADTGLPPVAITNGPSVSADAKTLYHTDTLGNRIWRVPINDNGSLGTPVLHIVIEAGAGHPDGSVIDAEGHLWTGLYGGWSVRRYDPAGKLVRSVRLPVAAVTKMAFGGPGLRTAYVTTARQGLGPADLQKQPLAGNLFTFDPGVAGNATTAADV